MCSINEPSYIIIMKSRVENILADKAYMPSMRRYSADDFDGYRAAPLLIVGQEADPELVTRQDELAWRMVDAAYGEVVTVAKPSVALFVARSTLARMQQREGMNGISYMHRSFTEPRIEQVPDADEGAIYEACRLAQRGEATPYQNDMARRALGMASVELANLTIFNEFRKELEPDMWQAVSDLAGRDASPKADESYGLRILGFDRDIFQYQHVGAVRVGMKRHIAELDDGTHIKSRTTAIINVSPSSGFDQDILDQFRECQGHSNPFEKMAEVSEFRRAVSWIIDSDLNPGIVLARNETVYEDSTCMVEQR